MENEIKAILRGLPGVKVQSVGSLWSISIGGSLSGARKDGKALAIDLRKQWEHIRDREQTADNVYFAAPEPVEIPAFLQDPEPPAPDPRLELQAARIAELEAQLASQSVAEPTPEMPPPDLADLIEYADTPVQTNEKLLVRLREVMGLIGLEEDDGNRAAPELYRRKDRLESGIRWNRGRMAEVI